MYDLLGQRKRMYVLQIPQGIDRTYSRQLWISEVRRFIDFISRKTGVEITNEMLRKAADRRNELRRARSELMELQRLSPVPISGQKLYKFMEGLNYNFDLEDAIASTRALTAEIRKAYEEAGNVKKEERRILITHRGSVGKSRGRRGTQRRRRRLL